MGGHIIDVLYIFTVISRIIDVLLYCVSQKCFASISEVEEQDPQKRGIEPKVKLKAATLKVRLSLATLRLSLLLL